MLNTFMLVAQILTCVTGKTCLYFTCISETFAAIFGWRVVTIARAHLYLPFISGNVTTRTPFRPLTPITSHYHLMMN